MSLDESRALEVFAIGSPSARSYALRIALATGNGFCIPRSAEERVFAHDDDKCRLHSLQQVRAGGRDLMKSRRSDGRPGLRWDVMFRDSPDPLRGSLSGLKAAGMRRNDPNKDLPNIPVLPISRILRSPLVRLFNRAILICFLFLSRRYSHL